MTSDTPIAKPAYAAFADRHNALAPTKPHNGLYERPASLALVGDVAGLDILDAGCGSGICTEKLARAGGNVRAFDVTPEMAALARERCAGLDVDIREGYMSKRQDWISDRSVDGVLCSLALDYVEKLQSVFSNSTALPGRAAGWSSPLATPCATGRMFAPEAKRPISKPIAGACTGAALVNPIPMSNPIAGRSMPSSMALPAPGGDSTVSSSRFPWPKCKASTPGILPN
jgi:SAM-dependent methyltransferase